VHEHCGEAGAIGAGIERPPLQQWPPHRFYRLRRRGKDHLRQPPQRGYALLFLQEQVHAYFIDVQIASSDESWKKSKIHTGWREAADRGQQLREGLVEDVADMREIKKVSTPPRRNSQYGGMAAKAAYKSYAPPAVADPLPKFAVTAKQKKRVEAMKKRASYRIGIPRILNMYTVNPSSALISRRWGFPRRT